MDTSLVDFVGIAIVGTGLSLIIQIIKNHWGIESNKTKLLTILLSILVGGFYFALRGTVLYETIIGILAASSTVYALILRK